jgi:hypothetical protein
MYYDSCIHVHVHACTCSKGLFCPSPIPNLGEAVLVPAQVHLPISARSDTYVLVHGVHVDVHVHACQKVGTQSATADSCFGLIGPRQCNTRVGQQPQQKTSLLYMYTYMYI